MKRTLKSNFTFLNFYVLIFLNRQKITSFKYSRPLDNKKKKTHNFKLKHVKYDIYYIYF